MVIDNVVQGSPAWMACRVGIPTASEFDRLITTKGEPSKSRQKYIYQLAGETITGQKEEQYQNQAMKNGNLREDDARKLYELISGDTVETVGICYPDKKKLWACSPDGLLNTEGLIEIKSPTLAVQVEYLLDGTLPTNYFRQVQGQMAVTGRKYVVFFAYYPGLKPLIVRVERNEVFIKALKVELELAVREIQIVVEKLKGEK